MRFRPDSNTATPLETNSCSYIYDGSISAFHEWDFRTQMRIAGASDDSEQRRAAKEVIEGLRGDAFDLAMDVGLARLMEDGGLRRSSPSRLRKPKLSSPRGRSRRDL